ncbi:MAG: hypothetical protein KBD25_07025 [Rickettsiaceae bacterium]|nr:hypothetical protein [Rickettsiaceae bacterium]
MDRPRFYNNLFSIALIFSSRGPINSAHYESGIKNGKELSAPLVATHEFSDLAPTNNNLPNQIFYQTCFEENGKANGKCGDETDTPLINVPMTLTIGTPDGNISVSTAISKGSNAHTILGYTDNDQSLSMFGRPQTVNVEMNDGSVTKVCLSPLAIPKRLIAGSGVKTRLDAAWSEKACKPDNPYSFPG